MGGNWGVALLLRVAAALWTGQLQGAHIQGEICTVNVPLHP